VELIMTGTGSPLPDPNRSGPSQLVKVDDRNFLIDCGRGCLMRLAAAGAPPITIERLLLTHLHSDHVTDVNDLITTRWVQGFPAPPLPIVGPEGTENFIENTLKMLEPDIGYRIEHHSDLDSPPQLQVRITAAMTEHKPVHPTVGYRIEAEGSSVVLAGDTIPCAGLDELCSGADVYVQTVIRDDLIKQLPIKRLLDVLDYHSTVEDAARTAKKAGVKILVLNHCVPAPSTQEDIDQWIQIASEYFDGEIILPSDLETINV
jgi:ribonuclease Z